MTVATLTMVQPPSPTLSNPAMILPEYGSYDGPPSPPHEWFLSRDAEPWKSVSDGRLAALRTDVFALEADRAVAANVDGGGVAAGPLTPTTPIIYGNGTCLSDIGEVTEAESISARTRKHADVVSPRRAGARQVPPHHSSHSRQAEIPHGGSPLRSSPTVQFDAIMKRTRQGTHERKISIESSSTVTSQGQAAEVMHDLVDQALLDAMDDDGASVDGSECMGDDEQSVADSFVDGPIGYDEDRFQDRQGMGSATQTSSAALSRRAEQILRSAKRRLNTMEGNLTRARSNLHHDTEAAPLPREDRQMSLRSTPSPPEQNGALGHQMPLGQPRILRHKRNLSDQSADSAMSAGRMPVRAASAAANFAADRTSWRTSSHDGRAVSSRSCRSPLGGPTNGVSLEPLSEDDTSVSRRTFESARSSLEGPSSDGRSAARPGSSLQVRDLHDQMQDLKGRLSVLRDRARNDTMRRRSLQSLRTPSPFTASPSWAAVEEEWPSASIDATRMQTKHSEKGSRLTGEQSITTMDESDAETLSIYEDPNDYPDVAPESLEATELGFPPDSEDIEEANAITSSSDFPQQKPSDQDFSEDYESDASYYHDTVVSHEDREDAFDYEHFFLHSAMGTIAAQRLARRASAESLSSEDSIETTKGPLMQQSSSDERDVAVQGPQSDPFLRADSVASMATVSSIATFATAQEMESDMTSRSPPDDHETDLLADYTDLEIDHRSTFGPQDVSNLPDDYKTKTRSPEKPAFIDTAHMRAVSYSSRGSLDSPYSGSVVSSQRSFPLVNKPKSQTSTRPASPATVMTASPVTPTHTKSYSNASSSTQGKASSVTDGSPQGKSHSISSHEVRRGNGMLAVPSDTDKSMPSPALDTRRRYTSPVDMLHQDDRVLVERLVASVGKCVLGLQEAGESEHEKQRWRRRLDAARELLEGVNGGVDARGGG